MHVDIMLPYTGTLNVIAQTLEKNSITIITTTIIILTITTTKNYYYVLLQWNVTIIITIAITRCFAGIRLFKRPI